MSSQRGIDRSAGAGVSVQPRSGVWAAYRLYFANPTVALGMPLVMLGVVVAASLIPALISLVSGDGSAVEAMALDDYSPFVIMVPAFVGAMAIRSAHPSLATGLGLGVSRRQVWLGLSLGHLTTALVLGVGAVGLLITEGATGHWFLGAHSLDGVLLGRGDALTLFATVTLVTLGGCFAGSMVGFLARDVHPVLMGVAAGFIVLHLVVGGLLVPLFFRDWGVTDPTALHWACLGVFAGVGMLFALASYFSARRITL